MRTWTKILVATLGVTAFGVIAGAAIAAPDQVLPMTRAATDMLIASVRPMIEQAVASASQFITVYMKDASPRTIAMVLAGAATFVLGAVALWLFVRNSRGPAMSRVPAVVSAPAASRRPGRSTPKQVRALAEQGSSRVDIARRTGLPVDAITLLLAVSDPARQLPPSSA